MELRIKILSVVLLLLFYVFFFVRAFLLSRKLGKSIKARDLVLNAAILSAGMASLILFLQILVPGSGKYFFIFSENRIALTAGTVLMFAGLLISSAASLNLGNSWRVGINGNEKTDLVTGGIYSISRNPYFLSYDAVLAGSSLVSQSAAVAFFSFLTAVMFHVLIIREERHLEAVHGADYLNYRKKVRRYL